MIPGLPRANSRIFHLLTPIAGRTDWNLDADGRLNLGIGGIYHLVPATTFQARLKLWGGAGGNNSATSRGGGGGYAAGAYVFLAGERYILVVGGKGLYGSGQPGGIGGGGAGGDSGNPASGAGLTGLFKNPFPYPYYPADLEERTLLQQYALLIAGGGGGGSGSAGRHGGAGGGWIGQQGMNQVVDGGGTGGGQAAGGFRAGASGSPLQAGTPTGTAGGGGGGGYWGGAGASSGSSGNRQAGGGGSGYGHANLIKGLILLGGDFGTPGNADDPDRQGSAMAPNLASGNGQDGRAIIF